MRATIGCLFESRSRTGQGAVIADYAFRTIRSVSPAQRLLALSVFAYAVVFLLLIAFGEPGLGVSQGFYLAIVLAALGTDAFVGAAAGATAACLYVAAEAMSGREGWSYVLSAGVSIRLSAYVVAGVAVGLFAQRARRAFGESLSIIDGLLELGRRATDELERSDRRPR